MAPIMATSSCSYSMSKGCHAADHAALCWAQAGLDLDLDHDHDHDHEDVNEEVNSRLCAHAPEEQQQYSHDHDHQQEQQHRGCAPLHRVKRVWHHLCLLECGADD